MNVFLTLDYELYLGGVPGSVEQCLVGPMAVIGDVAARHGVRLTLFVDVAYLLRLRELKGKFPALARDYTVVTDNLRSLARAGHDLQLHIHPQWVYSDYSEDEGWKLDMVHYKLSDIPEETAGRLFADGCRLLAELSGKRPVAFRAGGFSAQPVSLLRRLMVDNGLVFDSSVYPGTRYDTPQQSYDYTAARQGAMYRFGDDLCAVDPKGPLVELPLSVYNVSPLFYWRLALQRITKQKRHKRIGDGRSVKTASSSIRKRLTSRDLTHATIDEAKISFLFKAFKQALKRGDEVFCVIGHPKLATAYSLSRLDRVFKSMSRSGARFQTLSDIDPTTI